MIIVLGKQQQKGNKKNETIVLSTVPFLWRDRELNSRPPGYESDALTN